MRKCLFPIFVLLSVFCLHPILAFASDDPLKVANNKIGISILFDSEIGQAAKLVNSTGGDWGYVTIPIQTGDKDLIKWQHFMDQCQTLHVIPIIRLATEGDYFNTTSWRKPNYDDIIDFANFLNSLNWPVKNRYVIVYNEANRGDEWGGSSEPDSYAKILDYAVKEFKFVNPDFFIISAGLDNAAPYSPPSFLDEYTFLQSMNQTVPGIFGEIDGIGSHAYPNPGFAQPPNAYSRKGVGSFRFEQQLVQSLGGKKLPVFITETGWSDELVADDSRAKYYQQTLGTIWNDDSIVAITPFLLFANDTNFAQFSFIKPDGSTSKQYDALFNYPKTKGEPIINSVQVLTATTHTDITTVKYFPNVADHTHFPSLADDARSVFKWIFRL